MSAISRRVAKAAKRLGPETYNEFVASLPNEICEGILNCALATWQRTRSRPHMERAVEIWMDRAAELYDAGKPIPVLPADDQPDGDQAALDALLTRVGWNPADPPLPSPPPKNVGRPWLNPDGTTRMVEGYVPARPPGWSKQAVVKPIPWPMSRGKNGSND